MTTEDKSQMPLFSSEDEKEAQKELKRLRKNENGVFRVNHKRTGFEDKTFWDKLNLFGTLAIPIVVALATIAFGLIQFSLATQQHDADQKLAVQQHVSDQKIANQQHEADKQRALDLQQAAVLQTYLDNIQELLLHDNLRGSHPYDEIAIIVRARTLTALQELDPERKGHLILFLSEAQLIGFLNNMNKPRLPIIQLNDANLTGADLTSANLDGVHFEGANLTGANLEGARLSGYTYLTGANLTGANLTSALVLRGLIRLLPEGG